MGCAVCYPMRASLVMMSTIKPSLPASPSHLSLIFSALLLSALPPLLHSAKPDHDAHWWLDRMVRATHTLNYIGTFVYRNGDQLESMQIVHRVDDDGSRHERLISLSGVPWEVLRDGSRVTCIFPNNRSVVTGKSQRRPFLASTLFANSEAHRRYYDFSVAGKGRVAGRYTRIIEVKPLDKHRYGFRLWIDRGSGLLLKYELMDEDKERAPLEQFVYTNIRIPEHIPDSLLQPAITGDSFARYTREEGLRGERERTNASWETGWLPPGFELSAYARDEIPSHQQPIQRLVYTDGLSSFLVLIEPIESTKARLTGSSTMGAVSAFGRQVDDFQVTVFGEVPPDTVKSVALSVHRDAS